MSPTNIPISVLITYFTLVVIYLVMLPQMELWLSIPGGVVTAVMGVTLWLEFARPRDRRR